MFDEEIHLRDYLRIILKWRWIIAAVCSVVILLAAVKSFRQPYLYRTAARIIIEKKKPNVAQFGENVVWDSWDNEYLQSQYQIIASREIAARALPKLRASEDWPEEEQGVQSGVSLRQSVNHWLEKIGVPQPSPLSEEARSTVQEEQILEGLLGMVSVTPVRDSRLVDVSVTSIDREEAAKMANIWAQTYLEKNLENQIASSRQSIQWLVEEVEKTRQKLTESEVALQDYREQNAALSFEEKQNIVFQKVSDLSRALTKARVKRLELEAQDQKIREYTSATLKTLPTVINNYALHWMKVDLVRLEGQLSEAKRKFREKHPQVVALQSEVEQVRYKVNEEIARIAQSSVREYEIALKQEETLKVALEEQKQEALQLNQKSILYSILKKDVESNQDVYDTLLQKMKEVSIAERLETNNIRIVERAAIPTYPISPRRKRSLLLALVVGLVLGISTAFFLEYFDNSFKVPEDIGQYLEIPFLGFVPKMSFTRTLTEETKYLTETIVAAAPKSIISEAYRSLRTSITFSVFPDEISSDAHGAALLVTSSEPSEGKSCTVANLGIAMAQSGRKTLIVDCDFRKPTMHKIFNIQSDNGFADALTSAKTDGKKQHRGAIKRTGIPNLDVMPCGEIPPNPSELLSSPLTGMALHSLKKRYDMVLLDSPPVNLVTDSMVLSRLVNGVVMVISAGRTTQEVAKRSVERLQQTNATVIGGVLNNVDIQKNKYYYYYAYHYPQFYGKNDSFGLPRNSLFPTRLRKLGNAISAVIF